jgi:hypothetical protein
VKYKIIYVTAEFLCDTLGIECGSLLPGDKIKCPTTSDGKLFEFDTKENKFVGDSNEFCVVEIDSARNLFGITYVGGDEDGNS